MSVIKAAVFSDTHSNIEPMMEAIRLYKPDVVIHLGDHSRDADKIKERFPNVALYNVCGNCDPYSDAPNANIVQLGPVRALITHGHLYNVDWGNVDSLVYAAQEQGARLAMYGHTHRAQYTEVGGVQVLNPGTAGKSRELTWATVEVFDNGAFICQIREL